MKLCNLIIILLIFIGFNTWADVAYAVTCPSVGTINENCSWILADSPVTLGSITINSGVTATVEGGVSLLMTVDDIDVYGILSLNSGSSITATDNQDVADIRVHPGGILNMFSSSTIGYSESGRISVDVHGTAIISDSVLDVNSFKVYSGAISNVTNTSISAGIIAFYQGSQYTLTGNTLTGGVYVDSDGDGVPDSEDNCIDVANPDQVDSNLDEDDNSTKAGDQHYGNACDPDFDNNGIVNIIDFNEWRKYTGQSVPPAPASIDISGDGLIWIQDFNIWRQYYGKDPGPGIGD